MKLTHSKRYVLESSGLSDVVIVLMRCIIIQELPSLVKLLPESVKFAGM
jgi:hypothetical protein